MIKSMTLNYEDRDIFGHRMDVSATYDFDRTYYDYRIKEHKKELKRVLDFMNRPDSWDMRPFATLLVNYDDDSWDVITYEGDDDWHNQLLTVVHNVSYNSRDVPYLIDAGTLRRRLYKEIAALKDEDEAA